MQLPNITDYYQAHSSNFTPGRVRPIRCFTVHHTAANNTSLKALYQNPARNGSATFFVSATAREQYISLNDTPWTNGNLTSNQESLTCEVNGDWRFGYHNQATLNNLTEVMYQCLKKYPHLVLTFHKDVSRTTTLCPADLKDKGYALQCWNKAKARIAAETTTIPVISYTPIKPKRVMLKRQANLWNFNFTSWNAAKPANPKDFPDGFPKGHTVDVVAIATNQVGAKYYMTAYSYNEGKIRATHGINKNDVDDYVPPIIVDEPPVVTNPDVPTEVDVINKALVFGLLESIMKLIQGFIAKHK